MAPKISAELMLATCNSVKELRGTDGLPEEQADAILAALQHCFPTTTTIAPAEQEGNWGSLPDGIMERVIKAVQDPTRRAADRSVYPSQVPSHVCPWWRARAVCRSWNRAFSAQFQSWDMTLQCHVYEVGEPIVSQGPGGAKNTLKMTRIPGYRFMDRGLYGCYAKWLAERFPNLRHLSLPPFSGQLDSGPECDCPACNFISVSEPDHLGIAAILESLGEHRNLTSLEWKECPMLQDMHLEAISETLPQLECLILNSDADYSECEIDSWDQTMSNSGFKALAKLTSLRKLHIEVPDSSGTGEAPFITSAGPAMLASLHQLTSLTCSCKMSPGDEAAGDLERISRMVQLRELDLVGLGSDGDFGDSDDDEMPGMSKMRDKYLTPLTSLTNLCKLRLPVSSGWTRKGMKNLLKKLPNVRDHNEWCS